MVTGGRVKIGYQAVLRLLRCQCTVYTTTRFPKDAAARYSREEDFASWRDRLHILGEGEGEDEGEGEGEG